MSLQYVSDSLGRTTAVLIPIEEWNDLRTKHPDVDQLEGELPQWQKNLIDSRMKYLQEHPNEVISLEDFLEDFDKDNEEA